MYVIQAAFLQVPTDSTTHTHCHRSYPTVPLSTHCHSLPASMPHLPTLVLTKPFDCTLSFSAANAFFSSACFFLKADITQAHSGQQNRPSDGCAFYHRPATTLLLRLLISVSDPHPPR